jgi:Tfp pilus assembly protein PilV
MTPTLPTNTNRRARAFSLIEALVSVVLAGTGIVATMGGLSAIAKAESDAEDREYMQRLAIHEWDELNSNAELDTASNGDFQDIGVTGYTWTTVVESTTVTNLDHVTLTVAHEDDDTDSVQIDSVIYVPPTTTTTTAGTGATP